MNIIVRQVSSKYSIQTSPLLLSGSSALVLTDRVIDVNSVIRDVATRGMMKTGCSGKKNTDHDTASSKKLGTRALNTRGIQKRVIEISRDPRLFRRFPSVSSNALAPTELTLKPLMLKRS